jgi:glycosyltransferase involved in cell wall biosynthesis
VKIAYLSTFYPLRGGIAQFNASLYRALEKQGHEVKAFTFSRQYPNFLFPGQTQYVTPDDKAEPIPSEEILDSAIPFSWYKTARTIRKWEPDLLMMKYWISYFGPSLGTVARKLKNSTTVVTILDNVIPHEKRFMDSSFTKYFLRQNHGFVAMSNSVRDDLLTLRPGANCIRQDHPIYDHFGARVGVAEARKHLGLHPDKKTLLFFGFIRKYKGLDLLIKAFAELDDSYQLVIAGEVYGSFEEYQQLLDASPRKADIHVFTRYIPDHEVPFFFCASEVCVLPYRDGTQSGITNIAYHFNTPLIATPVGGLSETILPFHTGLMTGEVSPSSIAAGIRQFYADGPEGFSQRIPQMKEKTSWAAMARVLTEYASTLK